MVKSIMGNFHETGYLQYTKYMKSLHFVIMKTILYRIFLFRKISQGGGRGTAGDDCPLVRTVILAEEHHNRYLES